MGNPIDRKYTKEHEWIKIDGDIAIKGGKIVEVARSHKEHHADKRIDIDGKIVIPGCIDAHVHFRDPGQTKREILKQNQKVHCLAV